MHDILIVVFIFVIFILLSLGGYHNLFNSDITESEQGGEYIIYKKTIGSYNGMSSLMEELYLHLHIKLGVSVSQSIAIYYNDPCEIDEGDSHTDIGYLIEDINKIDANVLSEISNYFHIKSLPYSQSVCIETSYNGRFSLYAHAMRVYPMISRYFIQRGYIRGPLIEIYDAMENKVKYRQLIKKS